MKPTVHYTGEVHIVLRRAILTPVDHPNPEGLVTNGQPVTTSRIVNFDPSTGLIETENTIYLPKETAS